MKHKIFLFFLFLTLTSSIFANYKEALLERITPEVIASIKEQKSLLKTLPLPPEEMTSLEGLAKAYYSSSEPRVGSVPYKFADLAFSLLKHTTELPHAQRFLVECFVGEDWDNTYASRWSVVFEDEEEERKKEEHERAMAEHAAREREREREQERAMR